MKFKADWQHYLRALRSREIELIFGRCPQNAFPHALELGAGDGFQSTLLARYVGRLVATDYRPQITQRSDKRSSPTGMVPNPVDCPDILFTTCDAERVDEVFARGEFDLVFSSNMMEHLPDPGRALRGIHSVLGDDGVAVHVIPSPFWKLCHLAGFYPNAVLSRLDRLAARTGAGAVPPSTASDFGEWDNNPKVTGSEAGQRSYLARLLWPAAHGASGSNLREFALFSPRRWTAQFAAAGFRVVAIVPGPVSSGYGFGWDRLRSALERLGAASEYIYVAVKAGPAHGQPAMLSTGLETVPARRTASLVGLLRLKHLI